MLTLIQIDKSGSDLFEKDYSVVITVNKKEVYGVNIPQELKDKIIHNFKQGSLRIKGTSDKTTKNRLRMRFHTAVIILLIKKALYDLGDIGDISLEVCNDFDGHFHELGDMLFTQLQRLVPTILREDIVLARFQKPSLIDNAGKAFRLKDKEKLRDFTQVKIEFDEIYRLIKK